MSASQRLKVVLCWHMHQPEYRDPASGEYRLPWTYLHAIKDYVDMAAHLEAVPGGRAVVNFAPVLLDQIADYAEQVKAYQTPGGAIRDPLLAALVAPVLPMGRGERLGLIQACRRAHEQRLIDRFPDYARLVALAADIDRRPEVVDELGDDYLADLLIWYHLAWLGETVRRSDERVQRLLEQGGGFNLDDRRKLLEVIGELLDGLIGRYKALAARGQIELSMTPYAHPILPLLLDLGAAREALPEVRMPRRKIYPGGEERARWHIREGVETFRRHFEMTPAGCWPAEGGVSNAAVDLLGQYGFTWTASGEGVLRNSLARTQAITKNDKEAWLYQPYVVGTRGIRCFFRDDTLSDLIGFTYADWHGDDAVNDLVGRLEQTATAGADHPARVVSIILDGENAWEHYPDNGYHFLGALYRRLAEHPGLELTTFSACLQENPETEPLPQLVAGSWVHGDFATWIGDPDKNRGWDLLAEAKQAFDAAVDSGRLSPAQHVAAARQLAVCEGSDWFWWFGDYNPAKTVSEFEWLYRAQLAGLYRLLGKVPPDDLTHVLSHGRGAPAHGGVMRPGHAPA